MLLIQTILKAAFPSGLLLDSVPEVKGVQALMPCFPLLLLALL